MSIFVTMIVLGEGFICSSLILTRYCLKDNKSKGADMLIYPILFNINHGIEIYLKVIY